VAAAQEERFSRKTRNEIEEDFYYIILAKDLGYGDTSLLMSQLEEVSKLLEAYTTSILDSGS